MDRARTVQDEITGRAQGLQTRWAAVAAYTGRRRRAHHPAGTALIDETCAFLASLAGADRAHQRAS